MNNTYSPSEFNLQAQAANIRRKLFWARKNHPHMVATGRMSSIDSDKDIACMQATINTLEKLIEEMDQRLQPGLFERIAPSTGSGQAPAVNPPTA